MAAGLPAGRRIAPSILSADFGRLRSQIGEVIDAGAMIVHVDVMDGHFVPPITVGPLVVAAIADLVHTAGAVLDVHLMIEAPERQIGEFAAAGADVITLHQEATPDAGRALRAVRELGCLAGLAIKPATLAEVVPGLVDDLDLLLCMTVEPGWGGQEFIAASTDKVRRLRELLPSGAPIEVDGGIDGETAPRAAAAGARFFVAGSAIFGTPDPGAAYAELVAAAGAQ